MVCGSSTGRGETSDHRVGEKIMLCYWREGGNPEAFGGFEELRFEQTDLRFFGHVIIGQRFYV